MPIIVQIKLLFLNKFRKVILVYSNYRLFRLNNIHSSHNQFLQIISREYITYKLYLLKTFRLNILEDIIKRNFGCDI